MTTTTRREAPRRWARDWRVDGYLLAFVATDGHGLDTVVLARHERLAGQPPSGISGLSMSVDIGARMQPIDSGRWSLATRPDDDRWIPIRGIIRLSDHHDGLTSLRALLCSIARNCYCPSFPDTGCDFCNGTRLPPTINLSQRTTP